MWPLLRSLLFRLDPETAHHLVLKFLSFLQKRSLSKRSNVTGPAVCGVPALPLSAGDPPGSPSDVTRSMEFRKRSYMGLTFPNPIGLAAGFDKDAEAVVALQRFGFGFIEVGTVTAQPQEGNPKPRLFRLEKDQALFNRLGFNNKGASALSKKLETYRAKNLLHIPIGVNIGKSKIVSNDEASADYLESFQTVADVADYIVLNVSSPNTPGLRDLQSETMLTRLLETIANQNKKRHEPRPLLLKLSPDLSDEGAIAAGEVAFQYGFQGLIMSNTTISREGLISAVPEGAGGISGRPLFSRSTELLRKLRIHFQHRLVLIGSGGIMGPQMAREKLDSGADLIQVYTGFIYGGPKFVRHLLRDLSFNS